jgi:hypothetical protein
MAGSAAASSDRVPTASAAVPGRQNEKRYPVPRISFPFQIGAGKAMAWTLTVAAPGRT